jgi:MFS family permease
MADEEGPAAGRRWSPLWRHGDFMKFWFGETISLFGTQVTNLALPLTAVIVLGATPLQLGVLRFLEWIPFLLFALLVGVWVDRRRKRPVMMGANLFRGVLVGVVPVLAFVHQLHIPLLYVVTFLVGIGTVFFDLCWLSYVPVIVDRTLLVNANSRVSTSYSAAEVAGPGVAGFLVQLIGAPKAIIADAVSYLVSFVSLWLIKAEEPAPPAPADRNLRAEIGEGLKLVLRNRFVRATTAQGALWNFFMMIGDTIFLIYTIRQLHFSPGLLGVVLGAGAIGGIVGSGLASTVSRRFQYGRALVGAFFLGTVPAFLIPAAAGPKLVMAGIFIAAYFLIRFGLGISNVLAITLRQTVTPNRLLGRMNAGSRTILFGIGPLGGIVGGLLGTAVGLRPTLWIAAFGYLLTLVPVLLSPIPTLRELPPAAEEPTTAVPASAG